jgi:hypothetical protein
MYDAPHLTDFLNGRHLGPYNAQAWKDYWYLYNRTSDLTGNLRSTRRGRKILRSYGLSRYVQMSGRAAGRAR